MSTTPGEMALPEQAPRTLQEKIEQVQQQKALLLQLRTMGDPQLMKQAAVLQEQYHARDMAELGADVYRSAAHERPSPGLGWIRVSEYPELLKERLGVDWSEQQIEDYLQPRNSDFRAEIYLPDPLVYGTDVKPVISYKGSNGPVAIPDGKGDIQLRESALEDWIENARQGIGLESNHADRGMKLATALQRDFHGAFEFAGHSKGAVGASAGARLTGMSAYIFNGAGLHPNTVRRYATQHHLHVVDTEHIIHSYHVKGEVLHDTQAGVHDMDAVTRAQVGLAARQLGELAHLKDVHAITRKGLAQLLPYDPKMQTDALALIDYLGAHSGAQSLENMPLPAGATQIELPAKMRDARNHLIDRPAQPTLGDIGADAGPLMDIVSGTLAGGVIGKRYGDRIAADGRAFEHGAQWVGKATLQTMQIYGYVLNAGVQGHGRLVAGTIHYGGTTVASMRELKGQAQATMGRGQGSLAQLSAALDGVVLRAGSHIPGFEGWKELADQKAHAAATYAGQKQSEATQELREAHQGADYLRQRANQYSARAIRASTATGEALQRDAQQAGVLINQDYLAIGASVREVTDRVPEASAILGMITGFTTMTEGELTTNAASTFLQTSRVLKHGRSAATEAVTRHGMQDVVLPSLDASTREMENRAVERLHQLQVSPLQQPVTPGGNPRAFMQRMLESARSGDWASFRNDTRTLAAMQPGRDLHAHAVAQVDLQQQAAQQRIIVQQRAAPQTPTQGMGI